MGAALALLRNRPVIVDRLLVGLPDVEATIMAAVPGLAAVGHQGSVFDRPDLMRDLAARKTTPPARSHGPATMIGSII